MKAKSSLHVSRFYSINAFCSFQQHHLRIIQYKRPLVRGNLSLMSSISCRKNRKRMQSFLALLHINQNRHCWSKIHFNSNGIGVCNGAWNKVCWARFGVHIDFSTQPHCLFCIELGFCGADGKLAHFNTVEDTAEFNEDLASHFRTLLSVFHKEATNFNHVIIVYSKYLDMFSVTWRRD